MHKILIFTAGYGEGHNTAARSLKAGFERFGGCDAQVLDLFASTYGARNDFSRKAYLWMINHAPWIWQKAYSLLDRTRLLESLLFTLGRMEKALERLLEEQKPDAVMLTYPVYAFLLDRIYRGKERPFRQFTVVTDSITVNSVWFRPSTHWFIVPNHDTARVLVQSGIKESMIECAGFPVSPVFMESKVVRPEPGQIPKVLFMINFAKAHAPVLLSKLLGIPGIDITVTAGRDDQLVASLQAVAARAGRNVHVYGWTDQIPQLLMENHLLISKAGGATVQEALAAKTPMVISQVVPGQEEGNARLLIEHGCGVLAEGDAAIVQTVADLFADGAARWKQKLQNLLPLSRPAAALEIARFVLQNSARTNKN